MTAQPTSSTTPPPRSAGRHRHPSPLRRLLGLAVLVVAMLAALPLAPADASGSDRGASVVVANRGSGDISVIDSSSLEVESFDLPGEAEPMYVSHDRGNGRVLVGDRASSTIVALDDETYDVVGSVPVGDGVFHQWLDGAKRQLWVVGDSSQTVTVVDSRNLTVLETIDVPADLVAAGGRPHDVYVSGTRAFVTILGLDDGTGAVVQYSTRSFTETGRVSVGDDPHVFVRRGKLYVASQDSSTIARFRANDLHPAGSSTIPSAHGLFVTNRNEVLVTTIAGGGVDAVSELDSRLRTVRDTVDTDFPVPHNLTVDNRRQMFVTHSGGSASTVSVIDLLSSGFGQPRAVTVGTNPFGLAFVS